MFCWAASSSPQSGIRRFAEVCPVVNYLGIIYNSYNIQSCSEGSDAAIEATLYLCIARSGRDAMSRPAKTFAETLRITTSPPGATLEIDGVVVGTAPYHLEYPGGYFHRPHSVFGARLEHAMVLRVSKEGYLTQQITISSGPFEWVGLTGKHHGNYFLLRSGHFNIKLEPTLVNWEGTIEAAAGLVP